MKKKPIKRILTAVLILLLVAGTWFVWPRLPIITAFAAKGMRSSIFLANKSQNHVEAEDLSFFPISLARSVINFEDKSVKSTVFGLAKRKAVYREGLGAVLVLDKPEQELKEEEIKLPSPGYSQDTIPWPKGDILTGEKPAGVNYQRLNELIDTCFDAPGSEPFRKTLGIVVVYDNQLIAEKYLDDYNSKTMFHGWSMTKSITGALVGILAGEGKLNTDEPTGFSKWQNDDRKNITVKNIIQM